MSELIKNTVGIFIFLLFLLFIWCTTSSLFFYHVSLITKNQTTFEAIEYSYLGRNPFNRGIRGKVLIKTQIIYITC